MLAHRLDKLENDLQQLITMHDLYLQSDTESVIDGGTNNPVIWPDDVPVRDMSTTKKQTTRSTYQDNAISQANHPISQKESPPKSESTHNPNSEQLLKLNQELTEEVASVKARCKEVEESAKHVYIQLQKVQEDVRKEKEMKESLLVESMRVKGVADLFQAEIEKLKSEAAISKVYPYIESGYVKLVLHLKMMTECRWSWNKWRLRSNHCRLKRQTWFRNYFTCVTRWDTTKTDLDTMLCAYTTKWLILIF